MTWRQPIARRAAGTPSAPTEVKRWSVSVKRAGAPIN
jgi:hypothetical protein